MDDDHYHNFNEYSTRCRYMCTLSHSLCRAQRANCLLLARAKDCQYGLRKRVALTHCILRITRQWYLVTINCKLMACCWHVPCNNHHLSHHGLADLDPWYQRSHGHNKLFVNVSLPEMYKYPFYYFLHEYPLHWDGLTLIHYKMWDNITHPFSNFNGAKLDIGSLLYLTLY